MVYICINWTSRQIKVCVRQVERRLKAYTYTAILFGSRTRRSKYSHIFDRVRVLKRTFTITIQRIATCQTSRDKCVWSFSFDQVRLESVYTAILLGSSMHTRSAVLFGSGVGIESIYTSCHLPDPSWSRTGSRMR